MSGALPQLRRPLPARHTAPPPPRGLSARSRRRWAEYHVEFELSLAASDLLGQALIALDVAEGCRVAIARDGLLVDGRYAGVPRAHPLAATQRDAVRTAERLMARLDLQLAEDSGRRSATPPARPAPPALRPGLRPLGLLPQVADQVDEP